MDTGTCLHAVRAYLTNDLHMPNVDFYTASPLIFYFVVTGTTLPGSGFNANATAHTGHSLHTESKSTLKQ